MNDSEKLKTLIDYILAKEDECIKSGEYIKLQAVQEILDYARCDLKIPTDTTEVLFEYTSEHLRMIIASCEKHGSYRLAELMSQALSNLYKARNDGNEQEIIEHYNACKDIYNSLSSEILKDCDV